MKYLNLGCGNRFDPNWINIVFFAYDKCVIQHNLHLGIPFPDNSFEMVYHSHLLEHFLKQDAAKFLIECFRVLKPGEIIRIAVPDLEAITKLYL